ncbi:unnamed protein product, partial [Linum tenue]
KAKAAAAGLSLSPLSFSPYPLSVLSSRNHKRREKNGEERKKNATSPSLTFAPPSEKRKKRRTETDFGLSLSLSSRLAKMMAQIKLNMS